MTSLTQVLHRNDTPVIPNGDQKMYKVASKREHNARKISQNYKLEESCVLICGVGNIHCIMALLLRFMGLATAITTLM